MSRSSRVTKPATGDSKPTGGRKTNGDKKSATTAKSSSSK